MARYIDADAEMEKLYLQNCVNCDVYNGEKCNTCKIDPIIKFLEDAPTADVAEVVRCKNCAFRVVAEDIPEFKGRPAMMCGRTFRITGEDEYCKYGIRKENNHD